MNAFNEKLRTGLWFLRRPVYWPHARELAARKIRPNRDSQKDRERASAWAAKRAISVVAALTKVGLIDGDTTTAIFPPTLLEGGNLLAERSGAKMGGPGDLNLLYAATKLSGSNRVVETGVAYGWSSLAILAALEDRAEARLVSVDMPYPKMNNEPWVGIVVPSPMRTNWELMREPDRRGLEKAIARFGGRIDLCHYDSDKSYWGRTYAYPLLWRALVPGGVFISDDIQDNMAFAEFVEKRELTFAVTEYEGKFVGITRRPSAPNV